MEYIPTSIICRRHLATSMINALGEWGFLEEDKEGTGTKEKVFFYEIPARKMRVVVYTSIVGDEVRETGKDAIRVTLLYRTDRDNTERGLASETRVNRAGDVTKIVDRLHERARENYKKAGSVQLCTSCGAPMFKAKSGRMTCAELCWKR